jgi:hypothetical protein
LRRILADAVPGASKTQRIRGWHGFGTKAKKTTVF